MKVKRKLSIMFLCLILTVGISSTVLASAAPNTSDTQVEKNPVKDKIIGRKHEGLGMKKLIEDLKLTKEDIKNADTSGKTFFDLAKEKGYTAQMVKDKLLKYEKEALDNAIKEGKLTKERADDIFLKKKEKISNWDGSLEKLMHKPRELKFLKDLGLTKEDIEKAKESGKTIYDLAKEKKNLSPQQVKEIMIKDKTEAINKKVSEGKITKEKGDEILTRIKNHIQNWDGKLSK